MNVFVRRVAVLAVAGMLSGCAMAMSPVSGSLFMNVKGPGPISPQQGSSKVGRSSAKSILGLVAMGDASIETAAKSAGITKIHHVDFESHNILGILASFTTVVYGE